MADEEKPKIFSDKLVQAIEDEVKNIVGEPMFRQLKAAIAKGPSVWDEVLDSTKRKGFKVPTEPQPAEPEEEVTPTAWQENVQRLVDEIEFKREGYKLLFLPDQKDPNGRPYLQIECTRPDAHTGVMGVGRGGKAYLSEHMTEGEILRRAIGLWLAYEEHEVRELFLWKGRAIFGPHIDPESLWEVAEELDFRS